MPRVVHFEIGVDDPPRAIKFYTDVFGWKIEKWGAPGSTMDYWLATTGEKAEPGIDGALAPRNEYRQPVVNSISVPSADGSMAKIREAGGQVLTPKMPIPNVGWFALCKDTEGNVFGIMQPDPAAR